jgi:hypothetical protein
MRRGGRTSESSLQGGSKSTLPYAIHFHGDGNRFVRRLASETMSFELLVVEGCKGISMRFPGIALSVDNVVILFFLR